MEKLRVGCGQLGWVAARSRRGWRVLEGKVGFDRIAGRGLGWEAAKDLGWEVARPRVGSGQV